MSPTFSHRKYFYEALGMKRKYTDLRLDSEPARFNKVGLPSLNLANQFQNGGPMPEVLVFKNAFPTKAYPAFTLPMLIFKEMVEASGNCYELVIHSPITMEPLFLEYEN